MRRRQIYALRATEEKTRMAALQLAETALQIAESIPVPKGTCPKCKKHIGRGVQFHAKACEG